MTILVTLLVVFVLLAVASIGLFILRRKIDNWCEIPLFVYNSVGAKFAACSVVDYVAASKTGERIAGKVLVSETVVTYNNFLYGYYPAQKADDLFVPFTSEGLMSFEEQEKFFVKIPDSEAFAAEKFCSMLLHDWRLRLTKWEKEHGKLEIFQFVSIAAAILCGIMWLLVSLFFIQNASREELVAVYMTSADEAAHRTIMKRGAPSTLLVPNVETVAPLIPGEVVRVEAFGSGVSYGCIRPYANKSTKDFCGFTSPATKLGDKMVLRSEVVRMWNFNSRARESEIAYNSPANFLITEREAETLLETGKFRIDHGPFNWSFPKSSPAGRPTSRRLFCLSIHQGKL